MATDGVKIIDSDLAHDTYTIFLDKFDRGIDIETIKAESIAEKDFYDEFDYEIFITSYALALWETGHLDEITLEEVKVTIKKGACIKKWNEWDISLGKARERILERFLSKISTPKKNPRRIKKFKPIQNVLFEENDVLIFKIENEYYASLIVTVEKIRNYCIYTFAITDFKSKEQPTIKDIVVSNILFSKIGCWESEEAISQRQPGLKDIFGSLDHEFGTKFFVGLTAITVEHRKLNKFLSNFIRLGQLKIIEGYKYRAGGGYDETFDKFSFSFKNFIDNYEVFKNFKINLSKILNKNLS